VASRTKEFITVVLAASAIAVGLSAAADKVSFRTDLFDGIEGMPAVEKAMFAAVNAKRVEKGLAPLIWDDRLAAAARQHSDEMKRLFYFSHESPTPGLASVADRVYNAGLTDMTIAENLASENNIPASASAEEVGEALTEMLIASEDHRENILEPRYTHSGIGCATSEEGTLFCTQVFSKRLLDFTKIELATASEETRKVTLTLRTDAEVGVWLDEKEVHIFEPTDGEVTIRLRFPYDKGSRKVAFASRPAGAFGKMKSFFLGTFDPKKPYDFSAGLTEVEVTGEEQVVARDEYYILKIAADIIAGAATVKIADGNVRFPVKVKGNRISASYAVPAGSGRHEVLFVVGDETGHGLVIDTDRPPPAAFDQITPE